MKRAADLRKYGPERDEYLESHQECERCGAPATCVHHKRGRTADLLRDQRWWAASCHACNMFAEDQTGQARAEGWLLSMISIPPNG